MTGKVKSEGTEGRSVPITRTVVGADRYLWHEPKRLQGLCRATSDRMAELTTSNHDIDNMITINKPTMRRIMVWGVCGRTQICPRNKRVNACENGAAQSRQRSAEVENAMSLKTVGCRMETLMHLKGLFDE